MSLTLTPSFAIDVEIAAPREVGPVHGGRLRVIAITGGRVHGDDLNGVVLAGGADWNTMRTDGVVEVWARYEIETDDGHILSVVNEGIGPVDRSAASGLVTRPRFTVPEAGPTWLTTSALVGHLRPSADGVTIDVYRVVES